MPGLAACGRCGARLAAAEGETFLPERLTPARRLARDVRGFLRLSDFKRYKAVAILLSVVPGMGHLYYGRYRGGLLFLAGGFLSLTLAARYDGAWPASWAIAGYCMLAAGAMVRFLSIPEDGTGWRHLALSACVIAAVWPLATVVSTRATLLWDTKYVSLEFPVGPLPADRLLPFDRTAYLETVPQVGDVVLTVRGNVDVVLAEPGDRLECTGESLLLNGQPARFRPFAFDGYPPDFAVALPGNTYFVMPYAVGEDARIANNFAALVLPAAFVAPSQILGRYAGPALPPFQGHPPREEERGIQRVERHATQPGAPEGD
jgi:hypothetical protein